MTAFHARLRDRSTRTEAPTSVAPRSGRSMFTALSSCAPAVSIRSAWRLAPPFRANAHDQLLRLWQGARTAT